MTDKPPPPPAQPGPSPAAAVPPPVPPGYPQKPPGLEGLNVWLIVPIVGVTALSCGVAGLPFNFVALVFAIMARAKYDRGELDRARKHLKRAKVFGIIGLALALANIVLGITAAITSSS